MRYPDNGHVESGGETISRTVTTPEGLEVEVRKLSVGPMDNNVYVLVQDGQALLVDAANDAERILQAVADVEVATILTTHGHGDHWQALEEVATATGAEVLHHRADDEMIPVAATRLVDGGEVLAVGGTTVELIHNPGHTPGSTSVLLAGTHLFTGDTLFPGGIGRTESPEAFGTAYESVTTRLFDRLPDETHVYPGHGDDTTIGTERPHLQEWRDRGW